MGSFGIILISIKRLRCESLKGVLGLLRVYTTIKRVTLIIVITTTC